MPLKSRYATKRYTKRGIKRWRARAIYVLDGETSEPTATGSTRAEADAKLDKVLERLAAQETPPGTTLTVTELFALLMTEKKTGSRPLKRSSVKEQTDLYKRHVMPYVGDVPIHELEYGDLERLRQRPLLNGHRRTAQRVQQVMDQLYRYALKRYRRDVATGKLILLNLAEDFEPVYIEPKAEPELWTPEQLQRFLSASEAMYEERITSLLHPVFYLAVAAGLRRGEVLGLPEDALELRDGVPVIKVRSQLIFQSGVEPYRDTPKSRAGVRDVPVGGEVAALLERHRERVEELKRRYPFEDQGLMFPSRTGAPIKPSTYYGYWRNLLEKLELPQAVPHLLRKTFVSYLTSQLIDAGTYDPKALMRLTGHADYRVTMTTYTLATSKEDLSPLELPGSALAPQTSEEAAN